jgi:NAD(P)-dependent dehydrogenase (short-subunit alcohol dehydrogenase family)
MSLKEFREVLEIDLIAPWYLTRQSLPHIRKVKGNIINISSISGHFGQVGSSTYCAAKGGLVAMTKSLAIDEAMYDVRVNAISPGNVWTPMWAEHVEGPTKEQDIKSGEGAQCLGRFGTPDELGEVALHLATATYTTGIEYLCTGGAEIGYGTKSRKNKDGTNSW